MDLIEFNTTEVARYIKGICTTLCPKHRFIVLQDEQKRLRIEMQFIRQIGNGIVIRTTKPIAEYIDDEGWKHSVMYHFAQRHKLDMMSDESIKSQMKQSIESFGGTCE